MSHGPKWLISASPGLRFASGLLLTVAMAAVVFGPSHASSAVTVGSSSPALAGSASQSQLFRTSLLRAQEQLRTSVLWDDGVRGIAVARRPFRAPHSSLPASRLGGNIVMSETINGTLTCGVGETCNGGNTCNQLQTTCDPGPTCSGGNTCEATCLEWLTCDATETCVGAGGPTCGVAFTCGVNGATCTGGATCDNTPTCSGKHTCNGTDTCYGPHTEPPTCDGSITCRVGATCDGTASCNGSTTCDAAVTCATGGATCQAGYGTCTSEETCRLSTCEASSTCSGGGETCAPNATCEPGCYPETYSGTQTCNDTSPTCDASCARRFRESGSFRDLRRSR